MQLKYFVVDAFTKEHFRGNPAGVCLVENEISDIVMQSIASENNLAETAFLVKQEGYYDLRWFTPEEEIDLCGHATLGSAYVIMNYVDTEADKIEFHTKSGNLYVSRKQDLYSLDFPTRRPIPCKVPDLLEEALGVKVFETHKARDLVVLVEDEDTVRNLQPNFMLLKQINEAFGLAVTARGTDCDFVSRFFVPSAEIIEDPVTGSSHSSLIPFWSEILHKKEMVAKQLSKRGGTLYVKYCGERVEIAGTAVIHLIGEIVL